MECKGAEFNGEKAGSQGASQKS